MAKVDPRADPLSQPPSPKDDFSVDRVIIPNHAAVASIVRELVRVEDEEDPSPSPSGKVTSQDPRFERLEKLLDENDWRGIENELGGAEIGTLPPNLGLVAALARNENSKDGDPDAVTVAIRCMAAVLGSADDSPIARVLARRLLRKNPGRIRDRQAPPARTSVAIVIVTLVLGGAVGWLASMGSWRAVLRLLHL